MPRIRTLKPEHRQHRKTGALDHITYRLWIGMMLDADDEGRLVCDAEQLRVTIFGYHVKVTGALIESSLSTLASIGLLKMYTVDGIRYAWFPSWHDHQVINRPTPSKLPPYDDSMSIHGALIDDSRGNGKERNGMERNGVSGKPDSSPLQSQAREILEYLNKRSGRAFRPVDTNIGIIVARLKEGITLDQCRAVIGLRAAKWKGDPKMDEYLRPMTIFSRTNFHTYMGDLPIQVPDKEIIPDA